MDQETHLDFVVLPAFRLPAEVELLRHGDAEFLRHPFVEGHIVFIPDVDAGQQAGFRQDGEADILPLKDSARFPGLRPGQGVQKPADLMGSVQLNAVGNDQLIVRQGKMPRSASVALPLCQAIRMLPSSESVELSQQKRTSLPHMM